MPNPTPKPAAQKMLENIRALRAQGAPPERIKEEITYWRGRIEAESAEERKLSGVEKVAAVGSKMGSGATFGLLDEAVGLFDEDAKNEQRFLQQQLSEENPGVAMAAEIAGSIATPGSFLKVPAKGASWLRRAGTVVGEGAAQGAAAGFGNAEGSLEDRLGATAKGAGIGSIAAGVIGGAVRGASRIAQRGGEGLGLNAPTLDELVSRIPDDDIVSARQNLSRLSGRKLAHEATVADVLPQGEGALRQAATAGGREVREKVDSELRQRMNRLSNEADDRFSGYTGTQRQSAKRSIEDLNEEASQRAKPHYKAAEEEAANFKFADDAAPEFRIGDAVQLPYVQQRIAHLKSQPRSRFAKAADDDQKLLDQVYKDIGQEIRALPREKWSLKQDLVQQRALLAEAMTVRAPSYRKALDEFADPMQRRDAFELGNKRAPGDMVPSQMKGMDPAEASAFREGKAALLRQDAPNMDIGEFARFQDVLAPVASREKVEVFKATFGDKAYKEYVTDLLEMAGLQRMKAGGGESTTIDKALEQLNAEPEAIVGMIQSALTGNPISALTQRIPLAALDRLRNNKTAKVNADFLLRRGEPEVRRSLDELVTRRVRNNAGRGRQRSGEGIAARVVGSQVGGN